MVDVSAKVLKTGRLDGLTIQPISAAGGAVTHLHFTVDTLPGLRLIVEVDAARELRDALHALLQVYTESGDGR